MKKVSFSLAVLLSLTLPGVAGSANLSPNAPIALNAYQHPVRVACIGDSITAGAGTSNPAFLAYPSQLKRMLDSAHWEVTGFGVSGSTLMNEGDHPYQKTPAFEKALQSNPDVVVIMLGTNDTKPQNWKFKNQFIANYQALIAKFRALPSKPRIFVSLPVPVSGAGNYGINEAGVEEEMPMIEKIAGEENVGLIDLHSPFAGKDALFPDRVHPSTEGATLMAKTVFKALTGKAFEGEVPKVAHSQWQGFEKLDYLVADRLCTLVIPKNPAPAKPWIWRTEFFGAFPSVDLSLLGKGYRVAYMNVENMYGGPVAMDLMDKFYNHLVQEQGLAPKTVLEGFSRGGLFAFNWAARNPEKIASIYVDAPVCDFKSWPAGKGAAKASPADWERCLKAYGLTEEQALSYPLNPVDNLKPIAAAKIPIIAVYGEADTDLPIAENILVVEKRYRELGGEIRAIAKPGVGHHPHSLSDPQPVVDFILAHSHS